MLAHIIHSLMKLDSSVMEETLMAIMEDFF